MLSLEQVRGFVVVAEEGSFRRAAERLRMTQPPLSRQIQKLERDIGVQLLDRTQRQVELTPAGAVFLAEATRLLALAEAAPGAARLVAAGHTGTVRIGFTATAGFGFLGPFLNRISRALPTVELALSEAVSAQQFGELASGKLDLGLCRPPFERTEFDGVLVHRDPLVLAVPQRHRLDGEAVTVAELEGERFLVYAPGPARYFAELMARVLSGVSHEVGDRVTQVHTMLALVAAGRGVALVPETASHLHPEGVRYLPLTGVRERAELYAVWRRQPSNPALRRVADLLETWHDA
ncbi:LysR family transcriptional regulator [Nocardia sp. CDC160]|uniref:LysR family transcriptional regulator n=1 Tax=Nocardia sp. CDC160 TaxID=3112166 RepID=UPI002DBEAC61|nr:LysR family transcriptional regulator [Nocardia sp. CDC160]MEC3915726.1 LysR family transcriptional regulator [Nocardia sp. CDC160]